MTTTGSLAWSRRTGGTSPIDRLRLTARPAPPARLAGFARQRSGLDDRTLGRFDTDALPLPDSADARRALTTPLFHPRLAFISTACAPPRGALSCQGPRHRLRRRTTPGRQRPPRPWPRRRASGCDFDDACFAVHGARAAGRFADQLGWPTERRDRLAEAIGLHLNVRVGLAAGAEGPPPARQGCLDCIGARLRDPRPGHRRAPPPAPGGFSSA